MSIKDNLPTDIEISQIEFDKKSAEQILKLQSAEEATQKSVKDLAEKLDKVAKERKSYNENQFEMSRNYIQMVNRKSAIFQNSDLQELKAHIKNNESSIGVTADIVKNLKLLENAYKEYSDNLKECGKAWQKLVKAETEWYNALGELRKAQDRSETEKLDKIEKSMGKLKAEVQKMFSEKNHRSEFVAKSMERVDDMWQNVKGAIKELKW